MRTNTNFIVLQSLVISLTLTGCLSSGGGGDSAGTDGGGGNTPSAKANISGTVTGNASSGSYGSLAWMPQALRKLAAKISTQSAADGCAAGSFTGSFVGEGSTSAVSGTFSSGTFEIPDVVQGKELVLTFNCDDTTTQRCLVKSGDTGVKCDPIADSVIDAIEDSLAKNMTDASLAGKSLAKISSAIVQSVSTEDTSSESLREALLACKSLSGQAKATCIREAFASSNTAGTLKMAETLANGWTVDAIFTLLVDVYGARIGIDNFIYSSMATNLDSWIGTDFVAQTRTYLNSVITAQLSGTSNYVTKVECRLWYSKFQSGGQISYSPTMVTKDGLSQPLCKNDVALALNGLSPTQITNLYTGMANPMHQGIDLNGNAMPVDCNNAWKIPGAFCAWPPELVITSKFVEPNRNDPTGEHEEFYEAPRVELIGAFPELEQAIMTAMQTGPSGCLSMVPNGGPALNPTTECETWFGPIMAQQKKNFGGLMGLYLFLKGTNTGSLLSLDDIHRLFSKSNFMNMRLALRGHNACGSRVTDPDSGNSNHIPALAKFNPTTGLFNAQNGLSCNMDSSQAMTLESAQTAINDAQVPYSVSFSMFENIPSAVEINKFVFGAGTHSPWNPTGSRQFWAAGFKYSGSTFPILCRMLKKDNINNLIPKEGELDDKTVISCLTGTELAALTPPAEPPNTDGIMVLPKGYPYVLMNYGYQGDGKGSIFALADAKSGREIRIGEQPVLIQQLHSGNVNQCDGVTQTNGKVFKANLNMGFGDGTRSQASKVYCLDMSAFQETGSYFIYHGGMLSIKQVNDDGTSWTWMAPQVGVRNPTSPSQTLLPVCYFLSASDPGFDTNATTRLTTSTSLNSTTGELSSIGTNDAIDFCEKADLHVGATKYYLVMMGGWMNNDRTSLKMGLIGSETGARMLQFRNWSDANVTSWEDLHIYMTPATVEKFLNGNTGSYASGCTNSNQASCKAVAPISVQTPVYSIKLANQRWNPKFDPFCDDRNNNGRCDCFVAGTSTLKDPDQCTLMDDAAEPTLSQAPYSPDQPNADDLDTLFRNMGGLAGADLHLVRDDSGPTMTTFNGQYLQLSQLWFDVNGAFQCQYLASSETSYRTPAWLNWSDFGASNHGGCPATHGGTTASGGPVRLMKPIAANNTFAVSRPNTLIKMINYATKSSGQGISISRTEKKFTFDEAMALVALRRMMPVTDVAIHQPGITTPSASSRMRGTSLTFENVYLPDNQNNNNLDFVGAVLRAISYPADL